MSSASNPNSNQQPDETQLPSELDPIGAMALVEGTQQDHPSSEDTTSLEFTERETQMLKKLMASLALSATVMVESAISYTYFCAKTRQLPLSKAQKSRGPTPKYSVNVILSAEAQHKLRSLDMADRPSQCAAIGIKLLYDHLIEQAA